MTQVSTPIITNAINKVEEKLQCGADKYKKAVFTYKAMDNLTPKYITDLLKPVAETHNCTLQSSVDGALAVPRSPSSLFDRSYSYTAPKLWNSIPIPIGNAYL